MIGSSPFYFLGANAYYLPFIASCGRTAAVRALFNHARSLGMTVLRTWAFFDSPDTTDAGVMQFRPGILNETGLRGLDFVVAEANRSSMRLVLPLVNNWDEYGGMNQYVRWRGEAITGDHDQFYSDPVIKGWYQSYVSKLLTRINTVTGVAYMDDPAIMAWELANEPRSSDRSGQLVCRWLDEMSRFVKSIDPNHLVGSGEEGFDVSPAGYGASGGEDAARLFDGASGVSFALNSALPSLDFATIHLYPEAWSLPVNAANSWIRDHLRIADTLGKPLLLGEFGVRNGKAQAFESWLTTALLDGVAGSLAWQLLDGVKVDPEGFGFVCPGTDPVCVVLRDLAGKFNDKSRTGGLPLPSAARLHQNFPNPFHSHTVVTYELPFDAHVRLELFDVTGVRVLTVVDDVQRPGVRKEVIDGCALAAGAYFYRITAVEIHGGLDRGYTETRRLMVLH
jgi:mannan endo-1,4-beta-mannosidase